ncbi:hypothetical protein CcrKarma_gp235 [Caulobacter virus Karma]|uniref:Uncharacterized protein n=6 Tax=Viruses TaxID=10239 RepID=K4JRX6_9CAUD|nr:hypothetical protein D865_gp195 [Caulobacter phage phiCbK]YP_006988912.1 hypothetical protein CcrMagneto_gp230 [Caulobacter virus Magneto]YP_006989615.1 hypothetical protein CcrKarma_gp235 [Caulobacter virus Karma]YP_006989963.1 hypothetical protein D870_gp191 [Caulobacter phage CcrSwift]ARB13758.1 hypothetical protein Ccr10_gp228c [Caulobacter phage Ccr10]ARB14103.1 hypothetical protein Ccr2_gp227c [Caulobacter phage Ccr2]ARB14445.1 hypothetical protein Ccr5_gp225c [Caulobacter phage Ccr5
MAKKSKWEKIDEADGQVTERLAVEGGWLYSRRTRYTGGQDVALVFVPHPNPPKSVEIKE